MNPFDFFAMMDTDFRLYSAQKDAFYPGQAYEDVVKTATPDFPTIEDAQTFAHKVQQSEFVRKQFPQFANFRPVEVTNASDMPMGNSGRTHMPNLSIQLRHDSVAMQKWVLLHEIAHVINALSNGHFDPLAPTYRASGPGMWIDDDGHGAKFAGIYLALVKEFLPEQNDNVRRAFLHNHVQITEVA